MRAAVVLAALSSLVMAAPSGEPGHASQIGVIFTYTNGTQSEMKWVDDSISQVALSTWNLAVGSSKRILTHLFRQRWHC